MRNDANDTDGHHEVGWTGEYVGRTGEYIEQITVQFGHADATWVVELLRVKDDKDVRRCSMLGASYRGWSINGQSHE